MPTFPATFPTFVTGQVAGVSTGLQQLSDALAIISGPRTAYTPVWGGHTGAPVLGNGTITGRYMQANKLVVFQADILIGSTTTFGTGYYTLTLPVAALKTTGVVACSVTLTDSSGSLTHVGGAQFDGVGTQIQFLDSAGPVNASAPWTWATGDTMSIEGSYEAA